MDLTPRQQQRVDALERVAGAPPVEAYDLRRELAAFGLLLVLLVGSVAAVTGVVMGALWLLT